MKLEIKEIKDRGTEAERIVLLAKEVCDIGEYFIFTSKITSNSKFSSSVKYPFWFPDKEVSKNDLVVLYTKNGDHSIKKNKDGTTSHFYYRKIDTPILTEGVATILLKLESWTGKE